MNLILTGDLHYEHSQATYYILDSFLASAAAKKPSAILIAGDLLSMIYSDRAMRCCGLLRKHFPDTPVITVLGNHDWWTQFGDKAYHQLAGHWQAAFKAHKISYIGDGGMYPIGNADIYGFDGWYSAPNPGGTNDPSYMNRELMAALKKRADNNVADICQRIFGTKAKGRDAIVLTHFDFTDHFMSGDHAWAQALAEAGADMLLVGHSHRPKTDVWDMTGQIGPSILNAGSDYNDPKLIEFEIA